MEDRHITLDEVLDYLDNIDAAEAAKYVVSIYKDTKANEFKEKELDSKETLQELEIQLKERELDSKERQHKLEIELKREVAELEATRLRQDSKGLLLKSAIAAVAGVATGGATLAIKNRHSNNLTDKVLRFQETGILSPINQKLIPFKDI